MWMATSGTLLIVASALAWMAWQQRRELAEQRELLGELQTSLKSHQQQAVETETNTRQSDAFEQRLSSSLSHVTNAFHTASASLESNNASLQNIQSLVASLEEPIFHVATIGGQVQQAASGNAGMLDHANHALQELIATADQLKALNATLEEIDKKATMINKVSSQANILSFNAAIEASKAGVYGAGFGVVADDIKRLAATSGQAASEIAKMSGLALNQVQKFINAIGEQMLVSKEELDKVSEGFGEITQQAGEVEQRAQDLAAQSAGATTHLTSMAEESRTAMEGLITLLSDVIGKLSGNEIANLLPQEVKSTLSSYTIIDVRRPDEFDGDLGHIPGAELICLQDRFADRIKGKEKGNKYLFVCRSGGRSARAARIAQAQGFSDITNLDGGMLKWREVFG